MGALGAAVFFGALWSGGWALTWRRRNVMPRLREQDRLETLPSGPGTLMMKLKVATIAYECYTYCSLAYLPAMPWQDVVRVPPGWPHPQLVVSLGVFELDLLAAELHDLLFVGACAALALSWLLLLWARGNTASTALVVQVFFDTLSFPVRTRRIAKHQPVMPSTASGCGTSSVFQARRPAPRSTDHEEAVGRVCLHLQRPCARW